MGNLTAKTSGEIASFMTPAKTNIKSLKVHFSPKQLGTGDPSPENVREIVGWDGVDLYYSGKNLFNLTAESFTSSTSYAYAPIPINFEAKFSFVKKNSDIDTSNIYFGVSYYMPTSSTEINKGYTWNMEKGIAQTGNKSKNIITYPSNTDIYLQVARYVVIYPKTAVADFFETYDVQLEIEPVTSYEPYHGNNILTNWTKNIKQWSYTDTTIDDSYSSNIFNEYGNGRWDNAITDIPSEWFGKELTYSAYIERSSSPLNDYDDVRVWCYGESTTLFDANRAQRFYDADTSGRSWVTFTIPEGTERIAFGLRLSKGSRVYNPQLEYGSEPTEYQPYVGTVYGGYIDLISGELIENYKYIRLDANTQCTEFRISDNGLYTIWYHINDMASGSIQTFYNDSNIMCNNIQKVLSRGSIPTTQLGILFGNNTNNVYLYNMNYVYGYTTKEEISAWLDENPVYVTVPLATPITHQLTPTQLQSFIGQNNFWSNADYVEIEYDLIETEDIQKCRKKIMLNQPHTESVIGDIANFTTNIKAPLKECKVYFNPIQEGSGDPSPDNVRNIVGWDSVEVNGCGKNLFTVENATIGYYTRAKDKDGYKAGSLNKLSTGSVTDYIKVIPNTYYYINFEKVNSWGNAGISFYQNKNIDSGIDGGIAQQELMAKNKTGASFLTPSNCYYIRIVYHNDYIKNQLELGSTATLYEPYQGTIASINWSNNVGTIYGGYIDLAKGELVATHKFVIYNGQEDGWNTYKVSQQIHFTRIISDKKIKMNSSISNLFPNANNIAFWDRKEYSIFGDHNTLPRIYVNAPYEMPDGVTEWKEWLSTNPLQVCYELAEPIHYSFTPQQLLTFKGENNIWSDTNGQTEVKFWTH